MNHYATLIVLLALAALPAAGQNRTAACAHIAVGTYLTTIVDAEGGLLSRAILTLHGDGTVESLDSNQAGVPGEFNPFTENNGEWACTGRNTVFATAISFQLRGAEGDEPGVSRNDFVIKIDRRSREIEGTVELIFFPLTANPFEDAGSNYGVYRFSGIPMKLPVR